MSGIRDNIRLQDYRGSKAPFRSVPKRRHQCHQQQPTIRNLPNYSPRRRQARLRSRTKRIPKHNLHRRQRKLSHRSRQSPINRARKRLPELPVLGQSSHPRRPHRLRLPRHKLHSPQRLLGLYQRALGTCQQEAVR